MRIDWMQASKEWGGGTYSASSAGVKSTD